jgi:hypothetical protein
LKDEWKLSQQAGKTISLKGRRKAQWGTYHGGAQEKFMWPRLQSKKVRS